MTRGHQPGPCEATLPAWARSKRQRGAQGPGLRVRGAAGRAAARWDRNRGASEAGLRDQGCGSHSAARNGAPRAPRLSWDPGPAPAPPPCPAIPAGAHLDTLPYCSPKLRRWRRGASAAPPPRAPPRAAAPPPPAAAGSHLPALGPGLRVCTASAGRGRPRRGPPCRGGGRGPEPPARPPRPSCRPPPAARTPTAAQGAAAVGVRAVTPGALAHSPAFSARTLLLSSPSVSVCRQQEPGVTLDLELGGGGLRRPSRLVKKPPKLTRGVPGVYGVKALHAAGLGSILRPNILVL